MNLLPSPSCTFAMHFRKQGSEGAKILPKAREQEIGRNKLHFY